MYPSFSLGNSTMKNSVGDTTLRLDGFSNGALEAENQRSDVTSRSAASSPLEDSCKLVLGLGPMPSVYSNDLSSKRDAVCDKGTSLQRRNSMLQLGLSVDSEAISNLLEFSTSTNGLPSDRLGIVRMDDEGSTSLKRSRGYMRKLIFAPAIGSSVVSTQTANSSFEQVDDAGSSAMSTFELGGTSSSRCKNSSGKNCRSHGCTRGARGSTGLCIGHGGGQRCQKPGCNKGSESRTAFCKAHGGGRRCQHLGCTKSAEGRTDRCIAHGGGRRCEFPEGCTKASRGKSGLCIKHGGGKRCRTEGCTKSAEGKVGLCISHGGGRRCQFVDCTRGAQGATMFCKAHGGGKRCTVGGCSKGAEGSTSLCKGHGGGKRCLFEGGGICPKSVHGGTNFCVAHGGGKRCVEPGCTKSARGKTSCCVAHGGGKRCKSPGCDKSAQGSTDFCKAHGGGKRCGWGEGKCGKFARGRDGLCAAHANLVRGGEAKGKGTIGPGLFRGLVLGGGNTSSSSGLSMLSDPYDSYEKQRPNKRQQLIPPQVLVPLSMKGPGFFGPRADKAAEGEVDLARLSGPEGRVHGGGLFLFGGDRNNSAGGI